MNKFVFYCFHKLTCNVPKVGAVAGEKRYSEVIAKLQKGVELFFRLETGHCAYLLL